MTFTLGMLSVLAAASTPLLLDLWGGRAPWSLGWVGAPIALAYSGVGGVYGLFFILPAIMEERGADAIMEGVRVPLFASCLALSLSMVALALGAVVCALVGVLRPGPEARFDPHALLGGVAGALVGGVLGGGLLALLPGLVELLPGLILPGLLALGLTLAVLASALRVDAEAPGRFAAVRITTGVAAATAVVLAGQTGQVHTLVGTLYGLASAAAASPELVQEGAAFAAWTPLAAGTLALVPLLAGLGASIPCLTRARTADAVSITVALGLGAGILTLGWCASEVAARSLDVVTETLPVQTEVPITLPR